VKLLLELLAENTKIVLLFFSYYKYRKEKYKFKNIASSQFSNSFIFIQERKYRIMNESMLLLFLLLIVFVILYVPAIVKIPASPNLENVSFSSIIRGCAQRERGMAPRGSFNEEKEPSITIEENKVEYSRALNHLCCRMVIVDRKLEGWTINIYENWSGLGCRCMCYSEISARIENLPDGVYTVNVYESGINPDGSRMKEKLIISDLVTV